MKRDVQLLEGQNPGRMTSIAMTSTTMKLVVGMEETVVTILMLIGPSGVM